MKHRQPFFTVLTLIVVFLSGCGGGGGGDTQAEPLLYSGNTSMASVSSTNAGALFDATIAGSSIGTSLNDAEDVAVASSANNAFRLLASGLQHRLRPALKDEFSSRDNSSEIAAIQVNDSYPCSAGGSTRFFGTLNDNGTGTLNIDFSNCREGNETIDGLISFQINSFDPVYLEITDGTMSFARITTSDADNSLSLSGSLRIQMNIPANSELLTIDMVARDNASNAMIKLESMRLALSYDDLFQPTTYSMLQTGRVYDSVHGYVDVTTTSPLLFSNVASEFPDQGGQLLISGVAGSSAKLIVASAQKIRIETDADGDNTFEQFMVYFWNDIGGALAPNEAPLVSSIRILPLTPYTSDRLTADTSQVKDPDADPLAYTYQWYKNSLAMPTQTGATLAPDQHLKGDVISVEVTVSDDSLSVTSTDSATILNSLPVVDAGLDLTLTFGDTLSLNSSVQDADNDVLSYSWTITSQPFDGNATFSDNSIPSPLLSYSGQDVYQISLSVSDGEASVSDKLSITVQPMALFKPRVNIDMPSRTESAAIGDLNGDGLNDVVVTTSFYFDEINDTRVFVLLQDVSGNLAAPVNYFAGMQARQDQIGSVAIADFNNDTRDDVVITYENGIGVLLQNTQGTLDPVTVYHSNHLSFSNSYLLVAADFNNDGLADVASIDWGTQSQAVDVYLQNPAATLSPPASYLASHSGYDDLAYGDVNGDGLLDLVVMGGQSYTGNLSILLQQPDHSFASVVNYELGLTESSRAVGVGDINGDARDDVVMAYGGNKPSSQLAVYLQNSAGTLDPYISLPSYDIPDAVVVADINGDGRKDIIVDHSGWNATGVYLQKADGSLMGEQRYQSEYATSGTHRLAVGDINADGKPDIVNAYGEGLVILYQ